MFGERKSKINTGIAVLAVLLAVSLLSLARIWRGGFRTDRRNTKGQNEEQFGQCRERRHRSGISTETGGVTAAALAVRNRKPQDNIPF